MFTFFLLGSVQAYVFNLEKTVFFCFVVVFVVCEAKRNAGFRDVCYTDAQAKEQLQVDEATRMNICYVNPLDRLKPSQDPFHGFTVSPSVSVRPR